MIQQIDYQCRTIAYIISGNLPLPDKTTFITPDECGQQVGYIVCKENQIINRHFHNAITREVVGTTEVLYILSGRCFVDFYDDTQNHIATHELKKGDLLIIVAGGHGFRMIENTVMLEIKQGPYCGLHERERF